MQPVLTLLFVALFLTGALYTPQGVRADLLEPGKKIIQPCVIIDNINSYPDHLFFLSNEGVGGLKQLRSDICTTVNYKFFEHYIIALPKSAFVPSAPENITYNEEQKIRELSSRSETIPFPPIETVSVVSPRQNPVIHVEVSLSNNQVKVLQQGDSYGKKKVDEGQIKMLILIGILFATSCGVVTAYVVRATRHHSSH